MSQVQAGRYTVSNDQDLVVFIIGARINRWWLLPLSVPILSKMNKMLRELQQDPESGLLAVQTVGLGATIQYWKSYEHLDKYANDPKKVHRPTWTAYFAKLFKNYAAGVWHETYLVRAGQYEAIYTNMPRRGLGLFKPLIAAQGAQKTSASRLGRAPA